MRVADLLGVIHVVPEAVCRALRLKQIQFLMGALQPQRLGQIDQRGLQRQQLALVFSRIEGWP